MKDTTETTIVGYPCPLCGGWISEEYFYVAGFPPNLNWCYDRPPCCKVTVAWLKTKDMLVYVGTFRNMQLANEWFVSAGFARRDIAPAGSEWDVIEQRSTIDPDEIPF